MRLKASKYYTLIVLHNNLRFLPFFPASCFWSECGDGKWANELISSKTQQHLPPVSKATESGHSANE